MSEDVTDAEVVSAALEARLIDLHTAQPARVESYNASKNTVDVTPMQYRQLPTDDGDYVAEALPMIPDVRVVFPRAGGFAITFPIQKGDFVLLVFCDSPLGAWRSNGQAGDPGDPERHTLSGAVAIPGVFPDQQVIGGASTSNMILGNINTPAAQVEITSSEVHLGAGATSFIALADKVLTELGKIATALSTHTHGGVTVGAGSTGTPAAPPYTASAVAAASSKAT